MPIPSALAEILTEFRAGKWNETPNPEGFLFVTRNGRPPSSNKVVEYQLWTLWGFHAVASTRSAHSQASLLLDSDATPKVAQRQLRHSDARTLDIYGHLVGDADRQAVEKVASLLDANGRQQITIN